ncbi:MAG: hypothetical protein Q8K89_03965 [Actinomycetota bacterium]|nr:hypothetical protein [Coriobacteriia bacterium]MDP2232769.1 hypothetical protein [Actinomycetota bacterium]
MRYKKREATPGAKAAFARDHMMYAIPPGMRARYTSVATPAGGVAANAASEPRENTTKGTAPETMAYVVTSRAVYRANSGFATSA